MKKLYFSALAVCGFLISNAQVFDVGSGAQVIDLSNTGIAVGSIDGAVHFMWSDENGISIIGETSEDGVTGNENISADGEVISATVVNPETGIDEAGVYIPMAGDEWIYFEGLGTVLDGNSSSAWGMSSNGDYVVGMAWVSGGTAHGVVFDHPNPTIDLGSTVEGRSSRANSISADGTRVVGWQDSDFGDRQGVYWENGEQHFLTDNDGNILGEALSVSADGKTITGFSLEGLGYIWNENEGTILYNPFADDEFAEDYFTSISGLSDDGKTAVGFSFSPFEGMLLGQSFIWTKEEGFKNLQDFVVNELGYDNLGIDFAVTTAISPDGQYIGGIGVNWTEEDIKGFVIKRPELMGTNDIVANDKVVVYPNPVKDFINIKSSEKIESIGIYNLVGQKLQSEQLKNNLLDVSYLAKGVYVLKIQTQSALKTVKIIKE